MNPNLRDRILRKLDTLSDERGYQALDYVEFLEARYAEKPAESGSLFRQFAEGLEDKLRAGKVSATTIVDTMGLLNKAVGMLEGVAAAGKSVANDIVTAAQRATGPTPGAPGGQPGGAAGAPTPSGGAAAGGAAPGTMSGAAGDPSAAGSSGTSTTPSSPGEQPS
jgi:hypothetical protein